MKPGNDWDRVFVAQFSTPNKVMPEGNKIWVLGDGVESNRPATNFPGISVDTNRVYCLVEKGDVVTEVHR